MLVNAPMPPERPLQIALLAGTTLPLAGELNGQMRTPGRTGGITVPLADDERAALRALFETAASQTAPVRRADVATATPDDLGVDRFRGSAVASLPTLP